MQAEKQNNEAKSEKSASGSLPNRLLPISLPKSDGAIGGMGKKFGAKPTTCSGSTAIPTFAAPFGHWANWRCHVFPPIWKTSHFCRTSVIACAMGTEKHYEPGSYSPEGGSSLTGTRRRMERYQNITD